MLYAACRPYGEWAPVRRVERSTHTFPYFSRTTASSNNQKPVQEIGQGCETKETLSTWSQDSFSFAIAKRCGGLWAFWWKLLIAALRAGFLFAFLIAASCKKQSLRNPSCDIIMIAYSSSKSLDLLPRKGQTEVIHLYVSVSLLLHPLWGKASTLLACGFHRCLLTAEEWAYN